MDWLITAHALGASLALLLGGWQLFHRPRGDRPHRRVGRVWVVAMYWTVLSSFLIKELEPGRFSWIHGLSAFTFLTLTVGTWASVRGWVHVHWPMMVGSYFGLVGAFAGAVAVPDRDIPQLVVHQPLVFAATSFAIVVAAATAVLLCSRDRRTLPPWSLRRSNLTSRTGPSPSPRAAASAASIRRTT